MNEFQLIDRYFKSIHLSDPSIILGIGDDAACVRVPPGHDLLISTDTLIADVHFSADWDPFDIAWKAVMVNLSDMAAMAALPRWMTLALTLPTLDSSWLERFSQGLQAALAQHKVHLIGGDTTRGTLSMTLTIHGICLTNQAITRSGAAVGDGIWVSGDLGGAAQALDWYRSNKQDFPLLKNKLHFPRPRLDLRTILQEFASAAIDISDGLAADIQHICESSQVGAILWEDHIPIHSLVCPSHPEKALAFALNGGDDYELCFTVANHHEYNLQNRLAEQGLSCYKIGEIEAQSGLRLRSTQGKVDNLPVKGYLHF